MIQPLPDIYVGSKETRQIAVTYAAGAQAEQAKNPDSATYLVVDPNRVTRGTADAGTATTLTDADRTEAADFWNGTVLVWTDADGTDWPCVVLDFAAGVFTFAAGEATPTEGDSYRILGYPVCPQKAVLSVAGNVVSFVLAAADEGNAVTARSGRRLIRLGCVFSEAPEYSLWSFSVLDPVAD